MNLEILEQRGGKIKKINEIVIGETPLHNLLQSMVPEENKVLYIHNPLYFSFTKNRRDEVINAAFDSYDFAILVNKLAGTPKLIKEQNIVEGSFIKDEIEYFFGEHIEQIYAEAIKSSSMRKLFENPYLTGNFILPDGTNEVKGKIIELN